MHRKSDGTWQRHANPWSLHVLCGDTGRKLSSSWSSLPLEGGVEAAYRAEINDAADPLAKLKEIESRLSQMKSPFRTAEKFWVEEIIDPRKTRSLLCDFARLAEHSGTDELRDPTLRD